MYPILPKEVKFLMVDYPTKGVIASELLGDTLRRKKLQLECGR